MKARPILLKSQEITSVLEGRKTQIRRILKAKQGGDCPAEMWVDQFALKDVIEWREQEDQWFGLMGYRTLALANCPFGKVGDHLWVRETWAGVNLYGEIALAYKADSEVIRVVENESFQDEDGLINYDDPRLEKHSFAVWADDLLDGKEGCWKPPVQMPRWASRILLEITNLRIERLNEISEADCVKEGIGSAFLRDCKKPKFIEQWGQIHGPDTWSQNLWVWVIDFRVVEGGES